MVEIDDVRADSVDEFINTLHRVHLDNSRMQYYAQKGRHRISMMPLTPFVYEFFLFNSLYQIDWQKSSQKCSLVYQPDEYKESQQQREFMKYLKDYARKNPSALYRAFEPLTHLPLMQDEWTTVTPDSRISIENGKSFFKRIQTLQEIVGACKNPNEMPTTKKIFEPIISNVHYIYMIRNNIFHGSKTLGDIYDKNQKLRIEVYELFLKGITSLFFISMGKNQVASDFIECPIFSNVLSSKQEIEEIYDTNTILTAIDRELIKKGDSRVIVQFIKQIPPSLSIPSEKSSLFYPSAGRDMITPLLLGLPYCTHFYFFERGQKIAKPPAIEKLLEKIPKVKINKFESIIGNSRSIRTAWKKSNHIHVLNFEYDGLAKTIHWIHLDNLEFLKYDVELSFYFHRGDSRGEGGSDQKWDSELLPKLKKKIPKGKQCLFLADGYPGGIDRNEIKSFNELTIPFLERERKYYYGYLV